MELGEEEFHVWFHFLLFGEDSHGIEGPLTPPLPPGRGDLQSRAGCRQSAGTAPRRAGRRRTCAAPGRKVAARKRDMGGGVTWRWASLEIRSGEGEAMNIATARIPWVDEPFFLFANLQPDLFCGNLADNQAVTRERLRLQLGPQ